MQPKSIQKAQRRLIGQQFVAKCVENREKVIVHIHWNAQTDRRAPAEGQIKAGNGVKLPLYLSANRLTAGIIRAFVASIYTD